MSVIKGIVKTKNKKKCLKSCSCHYESWRQSFEPLSTRTSEFEIPDIKNVRRPIRSRKGRKVLCWEKQEKFCVFQFFSTKVEKLEKMWNVVMRTSRDSFQLFPLDSFMQLWNNRNPLPLRTIAQAMFDCRWRHKKKDKLFSNEKDKLQVVYILCFHVKNKKRRKVKCVHSLPSEKRPIKLSFLLSSPSLPS